MKKTFTALVAVATMAGSLVSVAPSAMASDGQIAAGVAGGLVDPRRGGIAHRRAGCVGRAAGASSDRGDRPAGMGRVPRPIRC